MRPSVKSVKSTPQTSKAKVAQKENEQASNKPKAKRGSELTKASPATSIGKTDSIPAASKQARKVVAAKANKDLEDADISTSYAQINSDISGIMSKQDSADKKKQEDEDAYWQREAEKAIAECEQLNRERKERLLKNHEGVL